MSLSAFEKDQVERLRGLGLAWGAVAMLLAIDRKWDGPCVSAGTHYRDVVNDLTAAFGPAASPQLEDAVVQDIVRNGLGGR